MRLLGLDPGLRNTGWGVIDAEGNRLKHVAQGVVKTVDDASLAVRLRLSVRPSTITATPPGP